MTYEEAKIQIQAIPEKIWDQLSEPDREAMEMAFSALQAQEAKTQLSAEGTTSDLISRQDAIEVIEEMQMPIMRSMFPEEQFVFKGMSEALSAIKDLPSAQPEIEKRKEESAQNVPKEDLISRKAAIDALWEIRQEEISDGRRFHDYCSLSTAVDVIKDLPSAQPEPCEDAVSREAVYDAIVEKGQRSRRYKLGEIWELNGDEIREALDTLPSVQPDGWLEQNKDKILQAGMEGREIDFRIGGRLFAIREKAQ